MKSLQQTLNESLDVNKSGQASQIRGSVGRVLFKHGDELNKIKSYDNAIKFVDKIYTELNDPAKKYFDKEVRPTIDNMKNNPLKIQQYLYNIYTAGFEDSRIGKK